jgi:hypothetical protein
VSTALARQSSPNPVTTTYGDELVASEANRGGLNTQYGDLPVGQQSMYVPEYDENQARIIRADELNRYLRQIAPSHVNYQDARGNLQRDQRASQYAISQATTANADVTNQLNLDNSLAGARQGRSLARQINARNVNTSSINRRNSDVLSDLEQDLATRLTRLREDQAGRNDQMSQQFYEIFGGALDDNAMKFLQTMSNIPAPTLTSILSGYLGAERSRAVNTQKRINDYVTNADRILNAQEAMTRADMAIARGRVERANRYNTEQTTLENNALTSDATFDSHERNAKHNALVQAGVNELQRLTDKFTNEGNLTTDELGRLDALWKDQSIQAVMRRQVNTRYNTEARNATTTTGNTQRVYRTDEGTDANNRYSMEEKLAMIQESADKHNLNPNYLAALIRNESGFNENRVARTADGQVGGRGIAQFTGEGLRALHRNGFFTQYATPDQLMESVPDSIEAAATLNALNRDQIKRQYGVTEDHPQYYQILAAMYNDPKNIRVEGTGPDRRFTFTNTGQPTDSFARRIDAETIAGNHFPEYRIARGTAPANRVDSGNRILTQFAQDANIRQVNPAFTLGTDGVTFTPSTIRKVDPAFTLGTDSVIGVGLTTVPASIADPATPASGSTITADAAGVPVPTVEINIPTNTQAEASTGLVIPEQADTATPTEPLTSVVDPTLVPDGTETALETIVAPVDTTAQTTAIPNATDDPKMAQDFSNISNDQLVAFFENSGMEVPVNPTPDDFQAVNDWLMSLEDEEVVA